MSADIKHGAIQELPSDLATNAYQFLAVLSHLPREWIDMNHFKVVREDQWIKALGATRAVGAGYCDFLFGPEAETSFYAAVEVLAGAGLVDIWKSPKGNYLRLTAGIQYEWAHDYAFKDQYYDCGCAILFIAVGLRLNRGVQIMERHMYGCLEIAQRIAMKAEKVLDETKWQFVSLAIAILADGFAARKKYEEAEGLYYLSIASGRGQNSWYPKINRALMLGFAKGDWDSAKGGIEDAVAWSLPKDKHLRNRAYSTFMRNGELGVRSHPHYESEWRKIVRIVETAMGVDIDLMKWLNEIA